MANTMPTAAKLVAAISFAVVGGILANYFVLNLPEIGFLGPIQIGGALVGVFVGWSVMGNSVGKGYREATGSGLKTAMMLIVIGLFLIGLSEMLLKSSKMQYDGALDAILDVFQAMGKRSVGLLSLGIFGTAFFGGITGGMLTEYASRRWK